MWMNIVVKNKYGDTENPYIEDMLDRLDRMAYIQVDTENNRNRFTFMIKGRDDDFEDVIKLFLNYGWISEILSIDFDRG